MINRKPCICYICRKTIQKGQPKKREHKMNFSHKECKRKPKQLTRDEVFKEVVTKINSGELILNGGLRSEHEESLNS